MLPAIYCFDCKTLQRQYDEKKLPKEMLLRRLAAYCVYMVSLTLKLHSLIHIKVVCVSVSPNY